MVLISNTLISISRGDYKMAVSLYSIALKTLSHTDLLYEIMNVCNRILTLLTFNIGMSILRIHNMVLEKSE